MSMQRPDFWFTEQQYRWLVPIGNWRINEIPLETPRQVKDHFGVESSFALFASGAQADPSLISPTDSVIAGLDWVRHETRPKPGEPPLNVYHYFVGSESAGRYPVYYCGHNGGIAPGWSTLDDVMIYVKSTGSASK